MIATATNFTSTASATTVPVFTGPERLALAWFITAGVVEKHIASIFAKLSHPPYNDNRRVIAAIRYLES
jgi:hypothetical protein